MLKAALLLVCLSSTSGWLMPMSGAVRPVVGSAGSRSVRMEEPTTADADAFTEDLLDALAADEPLPPSSPGVFVTSEGAEELAPLPSYVNYRTVEEARQKYKTHETDTGSVQVQVAVLTARIAYMTKHMQDNKKDYASLRGLTAMVTRRRKLLEYLLREDLPEFKRVTAELGIRTNQLLKPKLAGARGRRV
jgi:small subunit ribosomal protein S15